MKRFWLTLVAAAVLTVAAVAPVAAQDTVTIDMKEVDGSGQTGSADITTDGEDQVIVAIEISAGEEGVEQPAHIHEGTCQDLGDVAYPLENVVDGVSETTVEVGMSELLAGEYAINVHLSEDESGTFVSCGTTPLIGGGSDDSEGDDEAASEDDEGDEAAEEDDEAAEEDDSATEEDEDDQAAEEDDEAAEEDDSATEEDEDDQAAEDASEDEGAEDEDDAAADEDGDDASEDEDAAAEEDADDAEEVAPATGSLGGPETGAGIGAMLLLAGGALGAGVLVRRRAHQA